MNAINKNTMKREMQDSEEKFRNTELNFFTRDKAKELMLQQKKRLQENKINNISRFNELLNRKENEQETEQVITVELQTIQELENNKTPGNHNINLEMLKQVESNFWDMEQMPRELTHYIKRETKCYAKTSEALHC